MKNVLVVDDTKNIRILLTTCLELRGYKVLTADCGQAVLDLIKKGNISVDLIFLDIRMPEMNGTEVLKAIRDEKINCPVIIMTAYATVKNAVDCTRLGAVAYLQKPFSTDRVNSVLDEMNMNASEKYNCSSAQAGESVILEKVKLFIEHRNYEEAHEKLKLALSINPYNKDIYYLMGKVNENMKNPREAKIFYSMFELFNE